MHPQPERIPFKRNEKILPIALRSHPDNPRTTNNTTTNIITPMIDNTSMLYYFTFASLNRFSDQRLISMSSRFT